MNIRINVELNLTQFGRANARGTPQCLVGNDPGDAGAGASRTHRCSDSTLSRIPFVRVIALCGGLRPGVQMTSNCLVVKAVWGPGAKQGQHDVGHTAKVRSTCSASQGAGQACGRAAVATVGQNCEFAAESVYWNGRGAPGGRDDGTCIIKADSPVRAKTSRAFVLAGRRSNRRAMVRSSPIGRGWNALRTVCDHVPDGNGADTRFVLNSTELRLIGFKMVNLPRIAPPLNVTRRSSRSGAQRAVVTAERTIYELSRSTDNAIMVTLGQVHFCMHSAIFITYSSGIFFISNSNVKFKR